MATLVYSDADGIDRSFALGADPIVVGRSAECAIRSEDPRVSRQHARFFLDQGSLWVEDLGSSNGIYVGPNKVQRAQVPIGEIVLVGSLMIRLLPASGTLPPPMGLHGTLASWLDMERKARAGIEEERNAFALRVGELHEELRTVRETTDANDGDSVRLRDELDTLRKQSAKELEAVRLELAKARDAKIAAETSAGMQIAEKLAEADMTISRLEHQLELARAQLGPAATRDSGQLDQIAMLTARSEKAEKDMVAAQIRAQGAERSLNAEKARTTDLEKKVVDADALRKELAAAKERLAEFDATVNEDRTKTLAAEAQDAKDKLSELDQEIAAAKQAGDEAERRAKSSEARVAELEAKLRSLSNAEERIDFARKEQEKARDRAANADERIVEATARADEAEKRAIAADTMAKAMAKDVAEALRRGVDAELKARGVARELDGAYKRAETAEKRDAELRAATQDAERRANEAESKLVEVGKELSDKLEKVQKELVAKADAATKELLGKLEQAQRELAAERQTATALVDRKTQLERELEEARTQLAGLQDRVELAEGKVGDYEVQIGELEGKLEELESGIAVEQTTSRSSLSEAKDKIKKLEEALGEARAAGKTATKTAAGLERRIDGLEAEVQKARLARDAIDFELGDARTQLAHARAEVQAAVSATAGDRERLDFAEGRTRELERAVDPLRAKAEAADLAIGRASALQRQLDEALQKLSWIERDGARASSDTAEQLNSLEQRARDAEERARISEDHLQNERSRVQLAEAHAQQQADYAHEIEKRSNEIEARAMEIEARAKDIEQRAKDAAERIVDAERRARDKEDQLVAAKHRLAELESREPDEMPMRGGSDALERELEVARDRIAELESEVDSAENVRQFAASTEREIAQLQRELRETKAKLTQLTMERDNMESQLRDIRDDSETRDRRAVFPRDREATAMAGISYNELVKKTTELEKRLASQHRGDETTASGTHVPIEFAEHLSVIEESIDSLRANMRAASDETAMMEQSESVIAVASAVSQAAEHVERARDSVRVLVTLIKT